MMSTTLSMRHSFPWHARIPHTNGLSRSGSAEPIGGVSRFQSLMNYYRTNPRFADEPDILTFFSGDAFNPSLESTITKGRHMVPFLNKAGTDVACVGVSTATGFIWGWNTADPARIMISTSVSPNSATCRANAISLGYWPTCSIRRLETACQSLIVERPAC